MSFVLDTSVTMAWHFEDEVTRTTETILDRLKDEEALVPTLCTYDVGNVLLMAERRRRITTRYSGVVGPAGPGCW